MPHDSPDLPELVRTAQEFVNDVTNKLDGQDRYHALCVSYLLDIVMRELNEWRPVASADDRRIQALVNKDETVSLSAVQDLCSAIRAGDYDSRMDWLLDELIQHVTSKVAISKPAYLDDE